MTKEQVEEIIKKHLFGRHKQHKSDVVSYRGKLIINTVCGKDKVKFMSISWDYVTCKKCLAKRN